ncbi:hypothetical protein LCGC14_2011370 [marine sediment metagenome]|uniref:Uncharacterized protein n=1 Tax=marine sediment metagenome TaxID=412755 RepID=A0A0F9F0G6_9ZZZZ
MTNYNLNAEEPASHECTSDLSRLKKREGLVWQCSECHNPVFVEEVVEMLRERAVAQDAALRIHYLRGGTEESIVFAPVVGRPPFMYPTPNKLREQGGL